MHITPFLGILITLLSLASSATIPHKTRDYDLNTIRVLERNGYCVAISNFVINKQLYLGAAIEIAFDHFIANNYKTTSYQAGNWKVTLESKWWGAAIDAAAAISVWRKNLDSKPGTFAGSWAEHSAAVLSDASGNAAAMIYMWIENTVTKKTYKRAPMAEYFEEEEEEEGGDDGAARRDLSKRRYTDLCYNEGKVTSYNQNSAMTKDPSVCVWKVFQATNCNACCNGCDLLYTGCCPENQDCVQNYGEKA